MRITSLLLLTALSTLSQPFNPATQDIIASQLGLIWLQEEGKPPFAVGITLGTMSSERLYPGKHIKLTAKDSLGNSYELETEYDFNSQRALIMAIFPKMPQGTWVEITGEIEASSEYHVEKLSIPLNKADTVVKGEGYSLHCTQSDSSIITLHERGFTHVTRIDIVNDKGQSVDPDGNSVSSFGTQQRDTRFYYGEDVDVSKFIVNVERREAKKPIAVPVKLRFDLAGNSPKDSSADENKGGIELAPIPAELGKMRFGGYSLTRRAGVAGGRYEAMQFSLDFTPKETGDLVIPAGQKVLFTDGKGQTLKASLDFVVIEAPGMKEGDSKLIFRIDGQPQAMPLHLSGAIKVRQNGGKEATLPLDLTIKGFAK